MKKYEILRHIGEGSFGQVYKAKRRSDGEIVAFKMIRKVCARPRDRGRSKIINIVNSSLFSLLY